MIEGTPRLLNLSRVEYGPGVAWNNDRRYVKETQQAQALMPEKKPRKKAGTPRKRRKLAGKSLGLEPKETLTGAAPSQIGELQEAIENDGGQVLSSYREPFGGHWLVMAALPIEKVEPTPYQRNLSDTHVRKLESVIAKLGRFLDPIVVVRKESKDSLLDTQRQSSAIGHAHLGCQEHRRDRRARDCSGLPDSRAQYREST